MERQRFQFPSNWLYSDNIDGEWGAFNDILKRKDGSIQTQVASLQMKIVSEDKIVESKTTDLLAEWEKEKPIEVSRAWPKSESRDMIARSVVFARNIGNILRMPLSVSYRATWDRMLPQKPCKSWRASSPG